jgi:hypothetical protein
MVKRVELLCSEQSIAPLYKAANIVGVFAIFSGKNAASF